VLCMLLGAALSLMTIVASYLLLTWVFRRSRQQQVALVLGGFVVRLVLLFGLLSWVARSVSVNLNQLVLWLVSFYLVLVVAEARELAATQRKRTAEA
jgi:hypothetical protein